MLLRQTKNTFIRCTEDYGYITNQLLRHDRTYDEYGADLLKQISREPQSVDDIVDRLLKVYKDVDRQTLYNDFMEFVTDFFASEFVGINKLTETN